MSRGTVAGILKGYVGLSAAVYGMVYSVLLHHSSSMLLLFLALGIPALCFALMYYVRPCTPASGDDASESSYFLFIQAASIVLGVWLLTAAILNDVLPSITPVSFIFVVITVLLLMTPLAIPIQMTLYPSNCSKSASGGPEDPVVQSECHSETEPLIVPSSSATNVGSLHESDSMSDVGVLLAAGEGAIQKRRRPRRGEDFTFTEALVKADFWLLFLVYFIGVGSGVTVLNNLAQIGIAQGVENTTLLLCLFSFCNFVGRLGGGVISEIFVRSIYFLLVK